jgi:uncharacterized protein (TIGR02118 family)
VAGVKLVVIYPRPKDIEVFEKLYQEDHVPRVVDKLAGKTKFIATKVVATPDGTPPPFYRIAEVYFPVPGGIASVCVDDHTVDRFRRGYDPQLKRNRRK